MFAAVMAMAFFLFQLGIAEAGVSTLYPGAGNRPPKTPEWNVEKSRDENASAKAAEKNGGAAKGVKNLDKKNVPMTMLSEPPRARSVTRGLCDCEAAASGFAKAE